MTKVGLVYNFSHSRDAFHDDYTTFAQVWDRIQPYVSQMNITGLWADVGCCTYLSQGTRELDMMRTIQNSGWTGTVGILVRRKADTETVLKQELTGLDWLAAELSKPGSGGPRPVFPSEK